MLLIGNNIDPNTTDPNQKLKSWPKLISEKFDTNSKWNDKRKVGNSYKLNLNKN